MKKSSGLIDGIYLDLSIVIDSEVVTIDFNGSENFFIQNSEERFFVFNKFNSKNEISLLFFSEIFDLQSGVVIKIIELNQDNIYSLNYLDNSFNYILKLDTSFCKKNNIREGSILTLTEPLLGKEDNNNNV